MKSKLITFIQRLPSRMVYVSFCVLLLVYYLAMYNNMVIGFNDENTYQFIVLMVFSLFAIQVLVLSRYLTKVLQSAMIYLYVHFLVVELSGLTHDKAIFELNTSTVLSVVFLLLIATGLIYLLYVIIEHVRLKQ